MIFVTGDILLELTGITLSIISFFMVSYYLAKMLKPKKESKYYVFKYFGIVILIYFISRTNMTLYSNRDYFIMLTVIILPFIFSSDKVYKKILISLSWLISITLVNFIINTISIIRVGLSFVEANNMAYEELLLLLNRDGYGMVCIQAFAYTFQAFVLMGIILFTNSKLKNKLEIFLINLFTFLLVIVATIPAYYYIDDTSKIHLFIGLVSFIASIFIMVFTYNKIKFFEEYYASKLENEYLKDRIDMQLKYYRQVQEKEEEIRKINHDIKNNLQVIYSLKSEEDKENFINKIDLSLEKYELVKYSENDILNIVLNTKVNEAKSKNIKIDIILKNNISFMEDIDISNLFSNILDNAIENCLNKNGEKIDFSIIKNMNYVVIKCSNPYKENIKLDKHKKIKSRKSDNHGYGLKIIEEITNKYNGNLKIEYDDKIFTILIMIPVEN